MYDFLAAFVPVADAIATVLRPHAEVVIHDLGTGTIRHIANRLSPRHPGDGSLTELDDIESLDEAVIGPYSKTNWDGRRLKSITAVLRDGRRRAVGLLCINVDVSMFESMQAMAKDFLRFGETEAKPSALFRNDWREEVNDLVGQFLTDHGTTLAVMAIEQREALVRLLESRGLFDVRNAASYVAPLLGLSRATLYKTLKAVRETV
ncbi:PAS domain-containing protein [Dyella sp. 333MFSha]|uniref:helix-turn-helix transcriptional regulator n=1 Tax=Dyella sp. 333MFSha TaxID=1798240 RepID=UPI000880B3E1|nr:PAS domain-containing protein [Dyella sp. 333MFSha]SDG30701.1 Predicted transcriptional regulator YheO, contains PAS and DNA-binding HTH domains [Dyella sp. 333MFSha]